MVLNKQAIICDYMRLVAADVKS